MPELIQPFPYLWTFLNSGEHGSGSLFLCLQAVCHWAEVNCPVRASGFSSESGESNSSLLTRLLSVLGKVGQEDLVQCLSHGEHSINFSFVNYYY